jgi:2',3'-cyclic-nucleotide 2'-phosphodiesterase (5'-nucleotidase family)
VDGAARPIDPHAVYTVVTVDYLAGGGDGFTMFKPLAWHNSGLILSNILRDYVKERTPLVPRLEGRITRQ